MSTYLSQNTIEFSNGRDSKVHLFNSPELIIYVYYIPGADGTNPKWLDYSYNKHQLRLDVNVNPKKERKGSVVVVTNLGEHLFEVTLLDYNVTIPIITKDPIRVRVYTTSTSVPYNEGGEITGWVETIGVNKLTCSFEYEVTIGAKTKYDAIWDRWPITFKIPKHLNQDKTLRFKYIVTGTNSTNKAICEGHLLRSKYSGDLGPEGEDPIVTPPVINPPEEIEDKSKLYLEIGKTASTLKATNLNYTSDYTVNSYTFYVKSNGLVEINNSQSLASSTNFLDLLNFQSGNDNLAECSITIPSNADPSTKIYKFTITATLEGSTLSRTVTITQNYHVADTTLYIYKGALGRNGLGYSVDDDGILTSLTNWGTLEAYNNHVEITPNVSKLLFVAIPAESSRQVTRWVQSVLGVDQDKNNYKNIVLTKDSKNYKVYYYYNSTSSLSSSNLTKIYIS